MRVTQLSMSMTALAGIQQDLADLSTTQEQLSTGRVINKPSDDPVGTVVDLQARAAITRNTQYQTNTTDGLSWLGTADSALTSVTNDLTSANTLLVQAQSGAMNSTSMQALAAQLSSIRDDVLTQANSTYNNQPVFAGTAGVSAAYSSTGTYQGNGSVVTRQASDTTRVAASVPGTSVFGTAPNDVFTVLNQSITDLNNGASADTIAADMTALSKVTTGVETAHTQIGALETRMQAAQTSAQSAVTTLTATQASVESTDIAQATVTQASQQVAYQAALAAAAKAIQPSLLQFLS